MSSSFDYQPMKPEPKPDGSFVIRKESGIDLNSNSKEFFDQPLPEFNITFRDVLPLGGFAQLVQEMAAEGKSPVAALEIGGTGSWLLALKESGVATITALCEKDERGALTRFRQKRKRLFLIKGNANDAVAWGKLSQHKYDLIVNRPMSAIDTQMPTDEAAANLVQKMRSQLTEYGVLVTQLPVVADSWPDPAWITALKQDPTLEVQFVKPTMRVPDGNQMYLPMLRIQKKRPEPEKKETSAQETQTDQKPDSAAAPTPTATNTATG